MTTCWQRPVIAPRSGMAWRLRAEGRLTIEDRLCCLVLVRGRAEGRSATSRTPVRSPRA